ncbi:hypothetical protein [Streptomyces sp. NBC_00140]|uniref:hypothetical protein n=1 Tax=Streptomyces sp. NBC_00140 TaxID=2975664 RepID=UPI00224EF778|nr:hypothetical protein [Streptomyces sp. NBC_00140]MCX5337505.1 hypothetical protein [Streptomyces sp. NBC_00140]
MPTEETSPPGFLDLIPDPAAQDRLLLGIRHFDEPFLLTVSLSQGLGSSDLWLDRGRAGKARLAEFRRVGDGTSTPGRAVSSTPSPRSGPRPPW